MTTAIASGAADEARTQTSAPPTPEQRPSWRFCDMHLKVGDPVQVELPAHLGRVSVRVVGWVEGHCLILTVPHTASGRLGLHIGENVVVRVFTGRSAFAFRCAVLRSTLKPSDYLHLSFPTTIDGVHVRSSPRVRIALPASATPAAGSEARAVSVDNIGSTGALLVSPSRLGGPGDRIEVAFDLVLHDVPVSLALQAEIRSEDTDDRGMVRHGVAFVAPGPNDRLALAALVWFHMYENPQLRA